LPFASYENMADCIKKNASKRDPAAYCATIMRAVEGKAFVPATFECKEDLISGYANAPIIDYGDEKARDLIPADLWIKALTTFFAGGAKINLLHRPIFVAETVRVEKHPGKGPLLVVRPTKSWVKDMVADKTLTGYSIEYKLLDFELKASDDDDPRPIRVFKDFDLGRVSLVDEPMNPGSTFLRGEKMGIEDYSFVFDKENGLVTVEAKDEESFARLTHLFGEGLKQNEIPSTDIKAIAFKMAAKPVKQKEDTKSLIATIRGLLIKEENMLKGNDAEGLKALKSEFGDLQKKVEALQLTEDQRKAAEGLWKGLKDLFPEADDPLLKFKDDLDAMKAKLEKLDSDEETTKALTAKVEELQALLPKGEKDLGDRLEGLEKEQEEGKTSLAEMKEAMDRIVSYLEKERMPSQAKNPFEIKSAAQKEEDLWEGVV